MDYDTVRLDDENNAVVIIDQTKLPGKIEIISLHTAQEIWDAIYLLQVRGAPAIGVAAAYGIYVLAKQMDTEDYDTFYREFVRQKEYLDSSRPTAVNLSWALNRMQRVVEAHSGGDCSADQGGTAPGVCGDPGGRYLGVPDDRRAWSDSGKARGRHPDALQCRTACHKQIWNRDGTDLSGRGTRLSFSCICG